MLDMEVALAKFVDQFESGAERFAIASSVVAITAGTCIVGIKIVETVAGPFEGVGEIDMFNCGRAVAFLAAAHVIEKVAFDPMGGFIRRRSLTLKERQVLQLVSLLLIAAILLTAHGLVLGNVVDVWSHQHEAMSLSELATAAAIWVGTIILLVRVVVFLLRLGVR